MILFVFDCGLRVLWLISERREQLSGLSIFFLRQMRELPRVCSCRVARGHVGGYFEAVREWLCFWRAAAV